MHSAKRKEKYYERKALVKYKLPEKNWKDDKNYYYCNNY